MKVAIVSTHPIQYHTPWFRELARQKIELKVYYALMPDERQQGVGFGEAFAWDIPLLEGYDWELLPNTRKTPSLRGFFQSSTPAIYSKLTDSKPDVVVITGWQSLPLLQALWAAFRLGIPCIVRGESNSMRERPLLVQMWHRALLSRFDAFLAIGKANREFYRKYDIPEDRIFSANYFVDNRRFEDQFERARVKRTALRDEWKIPEGATCFLYVGKLEPKKRIMDLLRAVELVDTTDDRRPSIHLLVAGTGELMEEARAFVIEHKLPVTFAGFLNQTEITRAYAAADCLVLPSDYGETWGLVVNEAMACGLPAIVSDRVGCGPDLIDEGVTGSVFPCGDVDVLASTLVDFASDPEKLVLMGETARERIKDYSVESAVEGTIRAIEFVTGDDRRPTTDDRVTTDDRRPTTVVGHPSSVRVLHVIPSLSPKDGGPSFALPLIACGLEREGIVVDVATTVGGQEVRQAASLLTPPQSAQPGGRDKLAACRTVPLSNGDGPRTRDGVNYFYFRRQSEFYKVSLPLSRWLAEHIRDYDVVHIHALFSYASYAAAKLARENGVPYIVRPLGVLNRWGMQNRRRLLKRLSFRFVERRIVRNAAAIHYTSQQERLEAEEAGVRTDSVVIPLGIELSVFNKLADPERFYARFAHARGREIILFLSRLDPKKGLDLLLRAFAENDGRRNTEEGERGRKGEGETGRKGEETVLPLSPSPLVPISPSRLLPFSTSPRPLLVIAGEGDDQFVAGLRRLAEELGIADEIVWAGFLGGDDKLAAMAAASLFVLPSYSENFGIALVEAMAAGLPCVMSDQIGIAADAKEYDAGIVTTCEVGPLASAMQRLLDDPELRARLGANACRLVEDRFSVEAMSDSLVELYGRVTEDVRRETDKRPTTGNMRWEPVDRGRTTDDRRPKTADRPV